jgi:hypothetical protein
MIGKLTITYEDDTTVDVETKAIDAIRFERAYNQSVSAAVGEKMRMEHLWYFAYAALKRAGGTTLEFDDWAETVALVGVTESEAPPSSDEGPTPSP